MGWGGGSAGGGNGAGRRAHMSLLSLLRFANTQTRQGYRQNTRRMSSGIDPSVYCNAHLVLRVMSCAAVEAGCPSCSAAGYLMQASTQGAWGWLSRVIVVVLRVVEWVGR
jgi:hypothetical protein